MLWAKYNTQTTFSFPMIKRAVVDFAVTGDWTPASTDAAISKDNGNFADTTNTVAIVGGTPTRGVGVWKLTLTATELSCAVAVVQIVDAATKAVEDQCIEIYTYGNASAYFAGDWSDIVRLGLTALPNAAAGANTGLPVVGTQVPNATAGASNGLLINGSNSGTVTLAALTITGVTTHTGNVVLSDGLTISAPSTANRAGITITGNGTGAGVSITSGNGATGNALDLIANSTNGSALLTQGKGTGNGIKVTSISGDGIGVTVSTSGHGINVLAVGSSKHGVLITGGNAGTSDGLKCVAGTGGVDIRGAITGDITGSLSGSVGSVTGAVGSVTGNVGGNVTGTIGGLTAAALKDFFDTDTTTTYASAVAGSVVKEIADNAGGSSLTVADIADGVWDEALAGHTTAGSAGKALSDSSAAGDPWNIALPGAYAAGKAGYILGTNLDVILSTIKTKTDFLPSATAGAAGGVMIAGSNAATTFATLTVTGVTTHTGNVVFSDGITVSAPSTANRSGVSITGNGTGHGLNLQGGNGASGNGLMCQANATNGHGAIIQGSGAGDGAQYVGGPSAGGDGCTFSGGGGGGIAIRASDGITGSITGSLSGSVGSVTGAVGSVTAGVTVTTNNDKTGYSIGANGIDSGSITTAGKNSIADFVLDRNMATGTDSGTDSTAVRTMRQALRLLRNNSAVVAGTLTVTKEDDSTTSWTAAVTTTAGNPISQINPT